MPILPESSNNIILPKLVPITQIFPNQCLEDIESSINQQFISKNIKDLIIPGKTIAVLVGSRGISDLQKIVKTTILNLLHLGLEPFIVPSMGSHGGGISKAQKEIVENFGITEEYMGVPIKSSMDTIIIGYTQNGCPVHIDKFASEADYILPIARIKPHTDFDGEIESGICKMLSIGIGKHNGCSRIHQEGFENFPKILPEIASIVIDACHVPFSIAIIENAHEHVHTVQLVTQSETIPTEKQLLKISKSLMPRLCFDHLDVLIVNQIGKDITGAGMDPNITGRVGGSSIASFSGPSITRIVVNKLSQATHGNATGIGSADFITKELFESIDYESTYANLIACCTPSDGRIPMIFNTQQEALLAAIVTCEGIDKNNAKVVRIKDTLHLINIEVSESLLPYCENNKLFKTN